MQKQAPTLGRLLVMVGFALSCFGLLLFLWLAFGGPVPLKPKGYRFDVSFSEGTQLAKEADVRISGVSVGKVKDIVPNGKTGRSDATIEMKAEYAPIPKDSKAILRQKTLLGETYVELSPGHRAAGTIPENGQLANSRVSPTVELDEIFRAFDNKTRVSFQQWMQGLASAVDGRGQDINDALGNLAPFARDTNELLTILNSQDATVRRLVRNTGDVFTALSERDGELKGLIQNSNKVFATTAERNADLKATFVALPTFNQEAQKTVKRLSAFSQNANPLVTQLRPAARELSPTLTDLSALAPDAKALFRDLDKLTAASVKGLPATQSFLDQLHPLLPAFDPVLRQVNPLLSYIGAYKPELTAFFANTVGATEAFNIYNAGTWRFDAVLQPETRALWNQLLAQGWTDAARHLHPKERKSLYTFYVNDLAFRRDAGFRMDFHLISPSLVPRLVKSIVDSEHRGREKPSDHAPVWIELAEAGH